MDGRKPQKTIRFYLLAALAAQIFISTLSVAAIIETSFMANFDRAKFAGNYNTSQRRLTADLDFKFTAVSSIQIEYVDSVSKASYPTNVGTLLPHYTADNVTYQDRVYSVNWVQNLVPSKWVIQPYFKVGGGRMVRKYREELPEFNYVTTASENIVTGVGGLGLRIFLTKNMAIKGEFSTYVPKFHYKSWKDNEQVSYGISWTF